MSFHVGQKIVCIDDAPHTRYTPWLCTAGLDGLRKGIIYTVRHVGLYGGVPCVWLNEIFRPLRGELGVSEGEGGYDPRRFRPITERSTETGMAILRRILADHKAPSRVDAQMRDHDIFDQERA